jgi:predicted RNA methylase
MLTRLPHIAQTLADELRTNHPVTDASFDRLFPEELRVMSQVHWTPVDVARRVVALLAPMTGEQMIDVGAGVGKVCLIGALCSAARWEGHDLRARLVHAAENAAAHLGVADRTRFLQTEVTRIAWDRADGVYLYNPFGELLMAPDVSSLREVGPLGGLQVHAARTARSSAGGGDGGKLGSRIARVVTFHGLVDAGHRARAVQQPAGTDRALGPRRRLRRPRPHAPAAVRPPTRRDTRRPDTRGTRRRRRARPSREGVVVAG